ncbi:MAG: NTP transferase domain-containing protein [Actinobacteria bacterium]|nr:NTP transferase domain-containing protein [Actinomycetota bacterium]
MSEFAAILLTGGSGRRLGGISKAHLEVAGRSCFTHVLEALHSAQSVVVVGETIPHQDPRLIFIQEEPIGSGPVAAISAALPLVITKYVAIVSVDVPLVMGAFEELLSAWSSTDIALVASDGTHESYLVSLFDTDALRGAIAKLSTISNASVKSVLAHLSYRPVKVSNPDMLIDVDTREDLSRVEEILSRR